MCINKKINFYYFTKPLNIIKLVLLSLFVFYAPMFFIDNHNQLNNQRIPASEQTACMDIANSIITKKVEINPEAVNKQVAKFWKNKNGTFIGASYYKMSKAFFKKVKTWFMDINSNFRPIYYIEDDQASYPKIFKFLELKSSADVSPEFADVEKEVLGWMTKYKSYNTEMENLITEYSTLSSYVTKLRELKKDSSNSFPFEIQIKLMSEGKEQLYKDFIANSDDLESLMLKLKGKMKKLKGTSYSRLGMLDQREFEQALLQERLKALESELRSHLASHPEQDAIFKELLGDLIKTNHDNTYSPTLKFVSKLEFKEMNAEYRDLFKSAELDYKKVDEFSKKVIENLSPRYQQKLGINTVKNWVTQMKIGRMGLIIGGVGTLGTGTGAIALRVWQWINYDKDSTFDIVNAKDEQTFNDNLTKYLKGKFSMDLIIRIEKKNDNEMTLKNMNLKDKKDVEFVEFLNGIIVERKKFVHEEKLLADLETNLGNAIENVRSTGNPDEAKPEKPEEKKPDDKTDDKKPDDKKPDDKKPKDPKDPKKDPDPDPIHIPQHGIRIPIRQ